MIGFWRKRSKTFVIHLVFWPIIAVFVIWGFERYGNPVGAAAAVVNNRTITLTEYRLSLQRMMDFYSQLMQGRFDENMQRQYRIRETALQQLINNELIAEQAESIGLQVTDEEVRQKIMEFPVLQKEGRFSRENYDAMLRYYHQTPSQFESELKRSSLIEKTRSLFESNVMPTQAGLEKEKTLKTSKRNVEFLKIDKSQISENLNVSESAIDAFLKDEVSQKQIKENYDLQKSLYTQEEEVRAQHILIKAAKGNKTEEAAAQQKVLKILDEVKTKPFEELAQKYSDDPGSKVRGGELGWFGKGRMVPEFEKAAFGATVGQVVGPIQTAFGFHLIKVEEKKAAGITPFESVKRNIAKKLLVQKRTDEILSEIQKMLSSQPNEALKKFAALDPKVKWQESGNFTLADEQIPKIGENEELMAGVFSLSSEKPVASKVFQVGSSYFAIKFKPPGDKSTKLEKPGLDHSEKSPDLVKEMGRATFYAWAGKLHEKASIKTNPTLLNEGGGGGNDEPPPPDF